MNVFDLFRQSHMYIASAYMRKHVCTCVQIRLCETFYIKHRKHGKCNFTQNFEKRPRQSIRLVKIRMHTIRFVLTLRKVAFDLFFDFPMFGPSIGIPNVSVFNRTPLKGELPVQTVRFVVQ